MQNIYCNFALVFFLVINIKIAKTITSFLVFWNICWYNGFFTYKYSTQYGVSF